MAREEPPEDGKYIVQDGEWAGSIAIKFGYADWKNDVWMRSENADLREKRPDPRQLAKNDELFVPPLTDKDESRGTEKRHPFKLKAPTEVVRIRLVMPDGKPMKDEEYTLTLEYDPSGGAFKQENTKTDGDGMLKETIPSTATKGKLLIKKYKQTFTLRFGFLSPMDKNDEPLLIRGVQQRLLAIGFNPGAINGKMNPNLQGALKLFQKYCAEWKGKMDWVTDAGDVDGKLTQKTQDALVKFYGA